MPSDRKMIDGVEHVVHTMPGEPDAPVVQPIVEIAKIADPKSAST